MAAWIGATCAVVIPCLNEEATIACVVQGVSHYLPMVFVVDDASIDLEGCFGALVQQPHQLPVDPVDLRPRAVQLPIAHPIPPNILTKESFVTLARRHQ